VTLAGRVDGTVTRLNAVRLLSGHCPPGQHHRYAPADRRQINSQDTQTAGSVVSKSQAAYRHPTLSQSGGFRYNPTTSVTLAISSGSVENLNVSTRHGCTR
jgi:hypothetical protein